MKRYVANLVAYLPRLIAGDIINQNETYIMLAAQLHIKAIEHIEFVGCLSEVEFKAFSQWGEDGIIQYLINKIPIEDRVFIEFGVENYVESNTRFLLLNNNWKGLVIDGSKKHIKYIRDDTIYWKHDLTAVCQFITRENINDIFKSSGFVGDIGLLSIDIDGNDYWVWHEIDSIRPRIVVCEYNSVFGCKHRITVPYSAGFIRTEAHYSNLYYGASLPAICQLAKNKGYDFVGSNSTGSNAFFVRSDLEHGLRVFSADEGYVESKMRESRSKQGKLTFQTGVDRLRLIQDMPVYDIGKNRIVPIKDVT